MKILLNRWNGLLFAGCLALAALPVLTHAAASTNPGYAQVNLVSDIASNAPHTDARLINPWGLVAGGEGVWVNDNGTGLTTAYGPAGTAVRFAIHIPGVTGGFGPPTGLVFNDTMGFVITNGLRHAPSTFLMATEEGTIVAWSHGISGTSAVIVVNNVIPASLYKGLAIARDTNGSPQIYAANFHSGMVDVFDTHFQYVTSFTDPNLPLLFAPFNVRNIHGRLFVAFAKQKLPDKHDDEAGPGNGFVDVFDSDGTLLRNFAAQGPLNSPWGMAMAPNHFGKFSHSLLVGNFGDGKINAYDLLTGKLLGNLTTAAGDDLVIPGLWGLSFERSELFERECDFEAQRLYFTAGINDEADGLFGYLRPVSPSFPPIH